MISLEKWTILTHLQNLPRNVGDLGKLIAAKDFQKLPKVQKLPKLVTLKIARKTRWYVIRYPWNLFSMQGFIQSINWNLNTYCSLVRMNFVIKYNSCSRIRPHSLE